MNEPTPDGVRRYPDTQGFHSDLSKANAEPDRRCPCTCQPTCPARCSGECGCEACGLDYTIFCDEAGFLGPEGMNVPEDHALAAYRSF